MGENGGASAAIGVARRDEIREALISWFGENARDLPWRRTRDPWRVLVSEVMLQQIQVKRAVPFYECFLERFPTVEALADAPLAEAGWVFMSVLQGEDGEETTEAVQCRRCR